MSAATPKMNFHISSWETAWFMIRVGTEKLKLTQGGYPSVVTNVFDPTDKRICGSSPFGPINWSNISQSRLEGLKFWESIFRIEFEIISDCFEFNKRTFNSSQFILCLKCFFKEEHNLRLIRLTFSSDYRDPKLIFSLRLFFWARAKYLLSFLVSKMSNLKVQVQHGLVIGRTVSEVGIMSFQIIFMVLTFLKLLNKLILSFVFSNNRYDLYIKCNII